MKKITIFIIIIFSLFLTGCWDLQEPEKLGLVTLIGLDITEDNQIRMVVQEMTQQKQASGTVLGEMGSSSQVKLHEVIAPTIPEATQKMASIDFHRTYYQHANALILSEELVRSIGVNPLIDSWERSSEIRRTMWLLIAKKGQFESIFNTNVEAGTDTGKAIKEIIGNKSTNSYLTANTLTDFLTLVWEKGSEPYTAGISLIDIPVYEEKKTGGIKNESNSYDLSIYDTAVFKNLKMVGWMDEKESMGLLWATGGIKGGTITTKFKGKSLALRISDASTSVKPLIDNGKMVVEINIKLTSSIIQSQANIDYEDCEVIQKVEEAQAVEIKKEINAVFEKSKILGSDVFGFGNYFYGKYTDEWKKIGADWNNNFQNIELKINVKSTVNHIGLSRKTR
jgi:spore germination protein KC